MSIMNINVINICIANVFCRVSHLRQMLTQMQYLKFCTVKSNNYYRQYIASPVRDNYYLCEYMYEICIHCMCACDVSELYG